MLPLPSGFEWIVILVIALLILGPGKLPDVASSVGKSIREFRKASSDVQEAVKVDTSPLSAGPAQVTQATAPQPAVPAQPVAAQTTSQPNVLQTSSEPNVLTQTAPVADAAPTDGAPKADG